MADNKPTYEELEAQNRELKKQIDFLNSHYRSVVDNSLDAILVTDIDGNLFFANQAACDLFQMTPQEMIDGGRMAILDETDDRLPESLEAQEKTENFVAELKFKKEDGTIFPGEVSSAIYRGAEGQLLRSVIIRDVTERKQAEQALQEGEKKFRTIFEKGLSAIVVADDQGNYLAANKAAETLFGYTVEALLKMNVADLNTIIQPGAAEKYKKYLEKGEETGEFDFVDKNGDRKLAIYRAIRIRPDFNISMLFDITERKQAEQKIEKQQRLLRDAEQLSNIGSWEWDIENDIAYWSDGLFKIFKRSPKEGAPNWAVHQEFYVKEDFEKYATVVEECVKNGTPYEVALRTIRSDGEIRNCIARGRAEKNNEGKVIRLWGTLIDITERVKAEHALKENEEKYRNLVETLNEGIWQIDKDGKTTFVNARMAQILGYAKKDILGKHLFDFMDEQGAEKAVKLLQRRREGIIEQHEFEFITKTGNRVYLLVGTSPIIDAFGNYTGALAAAMDITDRKKAEQALRQSEANMHHILTHASVGIAAFDANMNYLFLSDKYKEYYKEHYNVGDVIGKNHYEIFPELPDHLIKSHQKALNGEVSRMTDDYLELDGTIGYHTWECRPWYRTDGSIGGISIFTEITTDRKVAALALKESMEKLNQAQRIGKIGSYETDLTTGAWTGSAEFCRMFGFEYGEEYQVEDFQNIVHPDDYDETMRIFAESLQNNIDFQHEYRCIHRETKEVMYVDSSSQIEYSPDGKALRILGTKQDITERVKAEQALKASEQKYTKLFGSLVDEVHVWRLIQDKRGEIKGWSLSDINPVALKGWNKRKEEVIGKTANEIFDYDTHAEFLPIVEKIFDTGEPYRWQSYFPPTDQYLDMYSIPFGDYFISTGRDITDLKQAERALQETLTDLELAQQIANVGNWQFDPEIGILIWSDTIYSIYERDPALGPLPSDEYKRFYDEEQYATLWTAFLRAIEEGIPYNMEFMLKFPPNRVKWIQAICKPAEKKGEAGYFLRGTIQDITERKQLEQMLRQANKQLEQLASMDGLTKIANRRQFDNYLAHQWQQTRALQLPFALIFADIDYFKAYNDTYGHQQGDECLRQVARALSQAVGHAMEQKEALVARYGGEEFGIVLSNITLTEAQQTLRGIQRKIASLKIEHESSKVSAHVTLSLGLSYTDTVQTTTEQELLELADEAMYRAKSNGRNSFEIIFRSSQE